MVKVRHPGKVIYEHLQYRYLGREGLEGSYAPDHGFS